MTDLQKLRKELSKKCIEILEKEIQKGRIPLNEIEMIITTEINNIAKNELK